MANRKDDYLVVLAIEGYPLGVFDKTSGGGVDSDELKYTPGGVGSTEKSLGGKKKAENITFTRLYDRRRDHPLAPWLFNLVGEGNCVGSKQPLGDDGLPFGEPIVYRGKLKTFTPGDYDSNATSAPDTFDLVISTEGVPS